MLAEFEIRDGSINFEFLCKLIEDNLKQRRIKALSKPGIRVLFNSRSNIFSNPGGDTVVIVNLKTELNKLGVEVEFSHICQSVHEYDLVHIFNFGTPYAINAASQGKPYIVTPMHEDFGQYYIKSMAVVSLLRDYMNSGDSDTFVKCLGMFRKENVCSASPDLNFITSNAEAILVSGESERFRIRKDFPEVKNVELVRLGFTQPADKNRVSPDLFISKYGVKNFVLCVGRLENRKNQLMLLYALRDEDIPLVFVNSKTIQPEYEELCKRFKRRGKTIFTGRISEEMLFSAYKAAKVHALTSWYELPGLVSLEAGWWGCNIVCSDWGTIRDYLGDHAYYCEPDNIESIRKAVLTALNVPPDPALPGILEVCTWGKSAERVYRIYKRTLSESKKVKELKRLKNKVEKAQNEILFCQMRMKAQDLSKKYPEEAIKISTELLKFRPNDPTSHFIRGTAYLALMKYPEADYDLKTTLTLQPYFDIKAYIYLSLTLLKQRKYEEAVEVLQQALKTNPFLPGETKDLICEYLTNAHKKISNSGKRGEIYPEIQAVRPDIF